MALKLRSPLYKESTSYTPKSWEEVQVAMIQNMTLWSNVTDSIMKKLFSSVSKLDTTTAYGQAQAFGKCAPVAAIIGRISEYSMNGRWAFVNKKGEEVQANSKLSDILTRPNFVQTWGEFVAQAVAMIKLHGQCYILPIYATGVDRTRTSSLFVIPNWMVTPTYSGKSVYQRELSDVVTSYKVSILSNEVDPSDMIVVRDVIPTIALDSNRMFEGMSRLYSLGDSVNNAIAIQDALYTLTTKRGALGAWVNDNPTDTGGRNPLTPGEISDVKDAFAGYGMTNDRTPYVVLKSSIKWVQAAMGVGDLQLFQGNDQAIIQIAMAYNMPMYLLGLKDSTFTNLAEAGKSVYSNAVIPCVNNIAHSLTTFFKLQGVELKCYFDHLDVFQKSKKDEADALNSLTTALDKPYKSQVIGRQEYRQMMANFMPMGVPFNPDETPEDVYEGTPTQTIVTQ
jgi:phage portal protein BeeE